MDISLSNTKIVVLLSTYNGERYLQEQLDSILAQEDVSCEILVRDDGSTDNTIGILNEYQHRGKLTWYTGDNLRSARSFMHLLQNAPCADFYAFCDQDDVWMPEKLSVAIKHLLQVNKPAMYCSDTLLVDASLNIKGNGGIRAEGTFVESLISNPVTGCTLVMNKELREIVLEYSPQEIDMHDWWIYRICMAVDGYFYYDEKPHIMYRQHGNNVVGGEISRLKVLKRRLDYFLHPSVGIRFVMANEISLGYRLYMTPENNQLLHLFVSYKASILNSIKLMCSPLVSLRDKKTSYKFKIAVLFRKF